MPPCRVPEARFSACFLFVACFEELSLRKSFGPRHSLGNQRGLTPLNFP